MEDVELPINFEFKCKNQDYRVVVREYLFGQWRLQLVSHSRHSTQWDKIEREACTYHITTAIKVRDEISDAADPKGYMEGLATAYNCEGPGQRIRLDNKLGDA
jgi:hypothetical protein